MKHFALAAAALLAAFTSSCSSRSTSVTAGTSDADSVLTILAGSYTAPGDTALRLLRFNPADTTLTVIGGTDRIPNASYITLAPSGNIYVASEGDSATALITAMRPGPEGTFPTIINKLPVGSAAPCYISVSPDGTFAVTADYFGATSSLFGIDPATGALTGLLRRITFSGSGPVPDRQDTPHPHCATFTPDGRFLIVNDLGTDRVNLFPLSPAGASEPVDTAAARHIPMPPATGPRHMVFNSRADRAYLIGEISDSVTVFSYDGSTLTPIQHIAADTAQAHGAADIHLSPDGRHLYASLRLKHEGIATFAVDSVSGLLTLLDHTPTLSHPRNFLITPSGRFLIVAAKNADAVQVFARNPATGLLTPTSTQLAIPSPVCLKIIP
ncbi:MAG: lactonase family protein [Muribaculaceae bacterium]|nr:lactonase family protein [Muribaculaceae bacterium]